MAYFNTSRAFFNTLRGTDFYKLRLFGYFCLISAINLYTASKWLDQYALTTRCDRVVYYKGVLYMGQTPPLSVSMRNTEYLQLKILIPHKRYFYLILYTKFFILSLYTRSKYNACSYSRQPWLLPSATSKCQPK